MNTQDELLKWKRRLPPAIWEAALSTGRGKPCTCKSGVTCWSCIANLEAAPSGKITVLGSDD